MNERLIFIWALQSLAASSEAQKRLFPQFACAPDELVLEHEGAERKFLDSAEAQHLTPEQLRSIRQLSEFIVGMSDRNDSSLWTDEALEQSTEWGKVRLLARETLSCFESEPLLPLSSEERGNLFFASNPR